jgi:hypothetical protein
MVKEMMMTMMTMMSPLQLKDAAKLHIHLRVEKIYEVTYSSSDLLFINVCICTETMFVFGSYRGGHLGCMSRLKNSVHLEVHNSLKKNKR